MSSERWERTKQILEEALFLAPGKRSEYLDSACGEDADLRSEVESLVASHEEAGSQFLDGAAPVVLGLVPEFSPVNSRAGQSVGSYKILEEIGRGGMGVVYKAEDSRLHRLVALKFLPGEIAATSTSFERFEREAQAASALDHPNICSIYQLGEHEDQPFIVMQLLDGQTLREWIETSVIKASAGGDDASRLRELLEIAVQIADGLEAAHGKGIIHRDIKPANIFITSRGQVKILDFGIAKYIDAAELAQLGEENENGEDAGFRDLHLTRTGVSLGTPSYLSPEQFRREKLDARTDLFSFGLVLYEMATGERAFPGTTATLIREAVLNAPEISVRRINPRLPVELDAVIARAIAKDRQQRYQTAAELRADLLGIQRAVDPERFGVSNATTAPLIPRVRKMLRRIAAPLVAVLAFGVIALFLHYRTEQARRLNEKDTLVLADFANSTSDTVFDGTLKQALSVALNQSPFLNILPESKVRSTLKLMTKPPDASLSRELASEVCQRSGS